MTMIRLAFAAAALTLLAACAADSYNKPGFVTEVKENRLWVFRDGSKELADYKAKGEPNTMVTRIGEGPKGMTLRAAASKTIEDYLAAK